jgi:cytochrome c6
MGGGMRCHTLVLFLPVLLAYVATGCGVVSAGENSSSSVPADFDRGRELFSGTCGSCHTLADAKTDGIVGPDLDGLRPDEARVKTAVENGLGAMPPRLLDGRNADVVATYVAEVAGRDER